MLTKEEIEARMQRRVDAIIRREKALAYSYPHQVAFNLKLLLSIVQQCDLILFIL